MNVNNKKKIDENFTLIDEVDIKNESSKDEQVAFKNILESMGASSNDNLFGDKPDKPEKSEEDNQIEEKENNSLDKKIGIDESNQNIDSTLNELYKKDSDNKVDKSSGKDNAKSNKETDNDELSEGRDTNKHPISQQEVSNDGPQLENDEKIEELISSNASDKSLEKLYSLKNYKMGDNGEVTFSDKFINDLSHIYKEITTNTPYTPEIFPNCEGNVQFEFELPNGAYLEIEITPNLTMNIFKIDKDGHEWEDGKFIDVDVNKINEEIINFHKENTENTKNTDIIKNEENKETMDSESKDVAQFDNNLNNNEIPSFKNEQSYQNHDKIPSLHFDNDNNDNSQNNIKKEKKEKIGKKNKERKNLFYKIVIPLLIISLLLNIGMLFSLKNNLSNSGANVVGNSDSSNHSKNTYNYQIASDLTEVIADAQNKTVGISVYSSNEMTGSGSGVIYKIDGKTAYIITNNHVIDSGNSYNVVFYNGESVEASLVGADQYGDIAVLKCTIDFDAEAFKIGDSENLLAGQTAIAIGSPLGIEYAGTVTQGIISSPSRTVSVDLNDDGTADWDMNVIQTDAAINPGNSGGALIDASGRLIGITSMKFASEEVEGMGFALPVHDAIKLVDEIMETGKVSRPSLGVSVVSMDEYYSYYNRLGFYNDMFGEPSNIDLNTEGVYVVQVQSNSAADKAGIQKGDIITKIENDEIDSYKTFLTKLYSYSAGDKIDLTIMRDNKTTTVTVTLGSIE